jgi:hypothetical protein
MDKNGLYLRGMVASTKVESFTKKGETAPSYSQKVTISDGENTYKYSEGILSPEVARKFEFGEPVEVQVNYVSMDGRTISVYGELTSLKSQKKSA